MEQGREQQTFWIRKATWTDFPKSMFITAPYITRDRKIAYTSKKKYVMGLER